MSTINGPIQHHRGTASAWTANNPTLADGELGYETDAGRAKVGDGSTPWTSLAYRFESGGGGGSGPLDAEQIDMTDPDEYPPDVDGFIDYDASGITKAGLVGLVPGGTVLRITDYPSSTDRDLFTVSAIRNGGSGHVGVFNGTSAPVYDGDLYGALATDSPYVASMVLAPLGGDGQWRVVGATPVPGGSGDVVGPASAVDDRIATFDSTTGKLIQDGGKTIAGVLSDAATYADGKVADAINDGTTGIAPSQNAVFDALALKAPLASPTFTGTPAVPTAAAATSTTQAASTAFVTAAESLIATRAPYVSGQYANLFGLGSSGAGSAINLTADTLYFSPFWVRTTTTFDRISFYQGGTTGTRVGIYASHATTGLPDALVVDAGASTSSGNIALTISTSLTRGWYWYAVVTAGTVAHGCGDHNNPQQVQVVGNAFSSQGMSNFCPRHAHTYGVLPSTASALTWSALSAPPGYLPVAALRAS